MISVPNFAFKSKISDSLRELSYAGQTIVSNCESLRPGADIAALHLQSGPTEFPPDKLDGFFALSPHNTSEKVNHSIFLSCFNSNIRILFKTRSDCSREDAQQIVTSLSLPMTVRSTFSPPTPSYYIPDVMNKLGHQL